MIDLASRPPAATISGADAGDLRSDLPPLISGDFNGDGVADVLLGARFGDGPDDTRKDAGEAYVIFGATGPLIDVDLGAGEQGMTVWGADPDDNLGFSAAAADVNDDGIDDIILGAPFARDPGDANAKVGAAYVVFGGGELGGSLDLADSVADVTLIGPGSTSYFGDSLATGDVNGDDIPDVIVGATFDGNPARPQDSPGATYVVFGGQSLPSALYMGNGEYDVAILGAEDLDELGDTVASGDINDDGIDDIIMTAEAADGPDNARPTAAEVHVVFGSKSLAGDLLISEGDQDLSILGADQNDTLGFSLAAGDVSGDGVDDLIIGARGDNGPMNAQNRVGAVYILPGGRDLPSTADLAQNPNGILALWGADDADSMAIAIVGDLEADGNNELLIGAAAADGPDNERRDAGDVYVLDAPTVGGLERSMSITALRLTAVIFGPGQDDHMGNAMTVADINGDGRPELFLLAADADGPGGGRVDAGQVFVVSLSGD
jgi:hypothetical protein